MSCLSSYRRALTRRGLICLLAFAPACSSPHASQADAGARQVTHDAEAVSATDAAVDGAEPASQDAAAAQDAGGMLAVACSDVRAELDHSPSAGELARPTGSVLRCAFDRTLSASDVDRLARTAGYVGPALASGARVLRILYRTERGTEPATPGFGAAAVLLPELPRAQKLPVLVMAHGTVGEAPGCPPSREDAAKNDTYLAELGFALVGAGYAVVLPDYAGYADFGASGNPPSGYHSAVDEAKSVLDAARALRKLQPAVFARELVLLGHSQGGHAVLSALAFHANYGSDSTLVGVVAYAPAWFPMTSFPGMLAVPSSYPLPDEADAVSAGVWYHYSHAELLDGPGQGALLFAADKRAAISEFFRTSCDPVAIAAIGSDIGQLYDASFAQDVAAFAGAGLPCISQRCSTWMERYKADRPHLTGVALSVPILLVHGDQDDWIPPERATCGFDRLEADGAKLSVCIVPGAKHDPVIGMRADYVSRWIAARTLAGDEPGSCGGDRSALHDDSGNAASCALLPPND